MRILLLPALVLFALNGEELRRGLPSDHPPVPPSDNRSKASALTERLRPSTGDPANASLSQKNLIDRYIFDKMQKEGVPHAPISSDEEFFRRVHIDLTGRIPHDDELRAFLASPGSR